MLSPREYEEFFLATVKICNYARQWALQADDFDREAIMWMLCSTRGKIETYAKNAKPPTSTMQVYNFEKKQVRVFIENGEPWWVAKDVAEALEYSFQANLIAHVPEEWKGIKPINTPGGIQKMLCLSEQGLYFFLGRSDKPKALPYQRWVAGEVIPSIRKTGRYSLSKNERDSIQERKLAVREKYAEARYLDAMARNARELRALAREHRAVLSQRFIEKIAI